MLNNALISYIIYRYNGCYYFYQAAARRQSHVIGGETSDVDSQPLAAKEKPSSKKKLNPKQIEILLLLYKFRFANVESIAKYQQLSSAKYTYKRLTNLVEQGYIGRNYDSSYRLANKPASYFLKSKAIIFLKRYQPANLNPQVLNNIYKDKAASQHFIDHSMVILELYNKLNELYEPPIGFWSKTELYPYDFFPRPLPDGYLVFSSQSRI